MCAADRTRRLREADVRRPRTAGVVRGVGRRVVGWGGNGTWTTELGGRHAIVIGADGRRVTGTATDALSPVMIEADTLVERSAGGEQRFAGMFIEDAIEVSSAIDLAAAIRIDGWQNRGGALAMTRGNGERTEMALADSSELQLDPRVGILGRLNDELAIRASVYRAFRAPTLNELYRPFQVGTVLTAANEALGPETLWGGEAGPQVVVSGIVVRATGFYNRLEDAIGNVTLMEPLPSGAMRQRQNFGTARIAGVELDASWRPSAAWTLSVAHTFMDAKVVAAPDQPNLVGQHRLGGRFCYCDRARVGFVVFRHLGLKFCGVFRRGETRCLDAVAQCNFTGTDLRIGEVEVGAILGHHRSLRFATGGPLQLGKGP